MLQLIVGVVLAQSVDKDAKMIEYDQRIAESYKTALPVAGVVPNEETAKAIAIAVAIPIWGKNQVDSELPLRAGLKGSVWTVIGTSPQHGFGGELIIQLDKRTGAVLSRLHTQ
jgi:hypothetical protein